MNILLTEDEYLVAQGIVESLQQDGHVVVGPAATVTDALERIETCAVDCAILDIQLQGDTVYPVADVLQARGIPYVFLSGYEFKPLPDRHQHITRVVKPLTPESRGLLLENLLLEVSGP